MAFNIYFEDLASTLIKEVLIYLKTKRETTTTKTVKKSEFSVNVR